MDGTLNGGKKILRFHKYSDTCGPDLRQSPIRVDHNHSPKLIKMVQVSL